MESATDVESVLAERASLRAQSVGELVDDLAAKGYVERRADPLDRRAKPVYLTDRGRTAVAASRVAVREQSAKSAKSSAPFATQSCVRWCSSCSRCRSIRRCGARPRRPTAIDHAIASK